MSGLSRLELEVAALLAAATGAQILTDVRVDAAGRTWRVDLAVETDRGRLLVDLDPQAWHQDTARDARKARALRGLDYVRVRPPGVPPLGPPARRPAARPARPRRPAASSPARRAARPSRRRLGGRARRTARRPRRRVPAPGPRAAAAALARAARQWQDLTGAAPGVTAAAVRPVLLGEYVANTTRPGIGLSCSPHRPGTGAYGGAEPAPTSGTPPSARAAAAAGTPDRGTGCPRCAAAATAERTRAQALPADGQSLADLHPDLAATFVECLSAPGLAAADLRPASNRTCLWRCDQCSTEYRTTVSARTRGRGCPDCGRRAAGLARRRPPAGGSLADLHPGLAAEYAGCPDRPGALPADLAPGSNALVRWRCAACAHEWTATPASRSSGAGCPPCARKRTVASRMRVSAGASLAELRPALAAQWQANSMHPGRGPDALTCGSHDRCIWQRPACDGTWAATVKNRTRNGTGCPACARGPRQPPA